MVAVGVREVAGVAAPIGLDGRLGDVDTACTELVEEGVDLVARSHVVGQREPVISAEAIRRQPRVGRQLAVWPEGEDQPSRSKNATPSAVDAGVQPSTSR